MATLIGIVGKVIGQVFAVSGDGTRRALVEGDRLFAGDQLTTGAQGAVAVHLQNGEELTLGRDSSMQMSPQLLANQIPHLDAPEALTPSEAQLTDVEQLQKAIAAGDDPTQTAEATAAGPTTTTGVPGGIGGSGHSFVLLEEVGGRVDPNIGFPTAGFNGIPQADLERHEGDPNFAVPLVDAPVVPPLVPPLVVPEVPNNPVSLNGLSVQNGELTLNEANLADGSASNPGALTQSGTFTVTALDGLTSLSVGGINVVSGGVAAGFPQSITTPLGGTLTITGFNPVTNVVSYSYTLNGSDSHPSGEGANSLGEQFTVVAGDSNGDSATGSLDINITDDVPKAVDDGNGIASETQLTLNGNVLDNDVQGADRVPVGENSGPITAGTFTGTYGTLVLNANGTYTYTLNTSDADFKALHGGGNGTETFSYTLTDADGDTSTANLVLQIHNNDDGVTLTGLDAQGGELTVYEKNLGDGSAPDASALTQSGTFTITALDGVTTLTVGGIAVVTNGVAAGFPQSVVTPLGSTLTITGFDATTGVVSYSYTLVDNEAHANANGANSLSEQFAVTVVDDNGTTANASLSVNIVDDLPQGVNDSNAGTASETLLTLNGNVLANDVQGADRVPVGENSGPITAGTFTGTYGTLVLNANGTYTYTLNTSDADFKALHGGGNGTETFSYTITDADGDTSTANLVLQVHNNNDGVTLTGLDVQGGELSVFEKNLEYGTQPDASALTQHGTFTVSALDGLQSLTVGGIAVVTNGAAAGFPQSALTPLGSVLTITGYDPATGVVSYSYTLVDNEAHANAAGANNLPESFDVVATDTDGDVATGQINVNIIDDLPTAHADTATVAEGGTITGNVLANDIGGADGPAAGGGVVGVRAGGDTSTSAIGGLNTQIHGTYGYLTLDAQGNAVYHSTANGVNGPGAVDVFTYTLRDSDGDESTTTITIDVNNSCIKAVSDNDVTVFEKALDTTKDGQDLSAGYVTGSDPSNPGETASGTLVGSVTGASGAIAYSLVGNAAGAYGVLQLNANGTYTYTLTTAPNTTPHANDGANVTHDTFTYQATDALGNTVTSTIVINIVDDVPTAHADAASVSEGGIVTGNVLVNDIGGADGPAAGGGVVGVRAGGDTSTSAIGGLNTQIHGTYGYLTLDAQGNAVYHSTANGVNGPGAVDVFTYTLRDSDGDESTTTITIDVNNSCIKAVSDNDVTVFEKALDTTKDGQDLSAGYVTGSDPSNPGETASGTLVGSVTGASGAITYSLVGNAAGAYGVLQLNANGTYTYTLTTAPNTTPHANDGANVTHDTFTYQATDALGNTVTSTIVINIVDDVPTAHADAASVSEGGIVTGNVLVNDIGGADGPAAGGGVVGVRAGGDTSTSAIGGLNTQIQGTYGYLTLDAQGNAVYHSTANGVNGPGAVDVFTYTLRDSDGDESTTTITIDVNNSCIKAVSDNDVTVFEKALDTTKDGQDLSAGYVTGSDPSNPGETASGTLAGSVTGASGAITYSLVGNAAGAYGVLQLNANGTYTYSLTTAPNTTPHANDGANVTHDTFTYQATDALGNTVTSTIVINIVDDVPTAHADAASVSEGGIVTGNVLVNDIGGADGPAAGGGVVGVRAGGDTSTSAIGGLNTQIHGTYGYLTLDAQGNAVYHSTANGVNGPGAVDVFTYTLRDSDGDESTTTITIDVNNSCIKAVSDNDVTVFEKALDTTKDGQDLSAGYVTGSDPSNPGETASGTLVGSVTGASGAITYSLVGNAAGAYGVLQLNANGTYTYTLTTAPNTTPHANDGANVTHDTFTYQATDALGNTVTSTIVINIVDDVPTAHADAASVSEGGIVTGNVLVNDIGGADGPAAGGGVVGVRAGGDTSSSAIGGLNTQIHGTYGYLTLDAQGNAVYHSTANGVNGPGAVDVFTYTLRDSDGDESTTTITIDVNNSCIKAVSDNDVTVFEKALDTTKDGQDLSAGYVTGSDPSNPGETASGTLVGSVTGASGAITYSLVGNAAGAYGVLQLNANGTYTYTLTTAPNTTPHANDGANVTHDTFTYQATDALGNTVTSTIVINIVDDVPTAHADAASVSEGGIVTGNVLVNDIGGADGPAAGGGVVGVRAGGDTSSSAIGGLNTQIHGTYGYLTLDAQGNAVYHSTANGVNGPGAVDVFTYTLRDSDGDESTTTLTIDVNNSCIKASVDNDVTVFEKALDTTQDGQDLAAGTVTGSDPGHNGETASGTLVGSVIDASGAINYSLVSSATGTYGQILLNADGTYTYTLTKPASTSPMANDGANTLSESFTYKATDAAGNSTTSTIVVNIVDDVPKAVASERSVAAVEIDSNLLIVLDVSSSMADASGVPGLSRLALAKQAISALLDKYDDLGDVKVQLVTFGTNATDKTSVWVDVTTAKSILAGLNASGTTNYDAAVATLQTAFDTSGKLTGAQNVGYFFSDGKPTNGKEIGSADEVSLKAFLDANNIKNYAIGLGSGVSNANLDPLSYDGISHTNTNAVVVTDLNQLNSVLSGTVVGAPVTGSLLGEGGTFGADGGFIKTITVDGTTYSYDPRASNNQGELTFSGGANHGTFNTVNNTLSIATNSSGTLLVNLDTGDYTYISQKTTAVGITENVGFTVSDNDGDLAGSTLTIKVIPDAAPVAADDHIITNVLSGNIVLPGELLLANDTDVNGDKLSATPTTFNTGWAAKGADFTGTGAINFAGIGNNAANQSLADVRNSFAANTAAMTAVLVVSGYLGNVTNANANDEDLITVKLKQGETLNLDHNLAAGHVTMEYSLNGGSFVTIEDGGTINAGADGTYQIHVTNISNTTGTIANAAESYQLTMTVNYAGAHDVTPDYHGTYTASDSHGGTDSAALTISYQDGHTLTGTSGDDVLVAGTGDNILNAGDGNDVLTAGPGNNELHGGAGNDLLYSGPGNDLLDGGTGIDTASYAHATAAVTVDLGLIGAQNTLGAGTDTLTGIENLVGSNFNDTLTGDNNSNVITGGLGNDVLNGGGGDDLLIGGLGNNTLTGGAGADTFQWLKDNSGHDVITDFTPGTDKLDLSQLLQGENGTTASLDDYLHFTVTGSGPSTVTSIDVSALAGAAPSQTIDLAGVNLASHYGVTPGAGGVVGGADTATIINGMLNDHSLKVDTV